MRIFIIDVVEFSTRIKSFSIHEKVVTFIRNYRRFDMSKSIDEFE